MSKYSELAKALSYRKVPIPAIQRHLRTIELIADTMRSGPSWIEVGSINFSMRFDIYQSGGPRRRVRFILSRFDRDGEMMYLERQIPGCNSVGSDEYRSLGPGAKPTAELIKQAFEYLYEGAEFVV